MTVPDEELRYTRDELIAELGLSPEFAEKIWNAFGFARTSTPDKIFTADDLAALRLFSDTETTMPREMQIATARAIGQATSRLADWQADRLRELDRDPRVPWSVDQMSAALGQIQQLIWRRHLAIALNHTVAHESDERLDLVVGFADIVGYTSLSRRIALDELENLLETFEEDTFELVAANGGHVVKTLGDGVMFTFHDPVAAAATAIEIDNHSEAGIIPTLRVGLARGHVLTRLGDVFGEPVNIAARLAGSARPGTILMDEPMADSLADDERFYVKSIPPLNVRGYRRLRARTLEANRNHDPSRPRA
ncbi:adenylate/guanylate cyclase domain-containing protein [Gordonia sp. CPCC 206044]|uniref:adenylate/guanylate cyclase domain-containing protein n=1 Tax=Gordonia sp. CPCC 206044 TaxID=3140793 RepID=UPI003AF36552